MNRRIEALKAGKTDWGHGGSTVVVLTPELEADPNVVILDFRPKHRARVHFHDDFCAYPVPLEMALAGVTMPEDGWRQR